MAINPGPQRQSKIINLGAMCPEEKDRFDALSKEEQALFLGFGGRPRPNFDVPDHNTLEYETSLGAATGFVGNCGVVLGLDRPNFENSGFGGQNGTHCAAIDIVAGRKAWFAHRKEMINGQCTPIKVDNDFVVDAARIYISQKTDVDGNFRLKPGKVGNTDMENPRSAVAIKADTVRLIARENIKLVTRTDKMNSQGGVCAQALKGQYGIDIVAMNDTDTLQPMVKGENLKNLLVAMIEVISQILSTLGTYVSETRKIHQALVAHKHLSPFYGSPTSPDFQLMADAIPVIINNITNVDVGNMTTQMALNQLTMEYLEPTGVEMVGKDRQSKNILSPYNSNN